MEILSLCAQMKVDGVVWNSESAILGRFYIDKLGDTFSPFRRYKDLNLG
jgi:hypothetical protein